MSRFGAADYEFEPESRLDGYRFDDEGEPIIGGPSTPTSDPEWLSYVPEPGRIRWGLIGLLALGGWYFWSRK